MGSTPRILLVEHLDAVGTSVSDLRPRAQVLRNLGAEVRMIALSSGADHDLQHGTSERRPSGIERFDETHGADAVRRAADQWLADAIVWVSAAPGGGEAARALDARRPALWWPSGWTPARHAGPLAAFAAGLTPGEGVVLDGERPRGPRLSLWDGPYALVASPLRAADAEHLFDGFARAADQRDEVDLVVLDHPDADLESVARTAGIAQRVHFVGRAPREAENAWLQHARVAFVTLQKPLSAGLVTRAVGVGCPLIAVGGAADPVNEFLREHGLTWSRPGRVRLSWDTVAAAFARTPAVETAIARGRALAAACTPAALAARLAPIVTLPGGGRHERAA